MVRYVMQSTIPTSENDMPDSLDKELEIPFTQEQVSGQYDNPILNEREHTHGDFADTARIAGALKRTIRKELYLRHTRGQAAITEAQIEALDLIATKIARIISGNAAEIDHWKDIAGYAGLGEVK